MTEQTSSTTSAKVNNESSTYKSRDIVLDGNVSEDMARKVTEQIIAINNYDSQCENKYTDYVRNPIRVIVNSYGGSVHDANLIIGVISTSNTPVHTYCFSKAMSAGLAIFIAGHKRYAGEMATFMYHDASVGISDSIHGIKHTYEYFVKLRDMCDKYILSRTNLPKHIMDKKKESKENWYFFADEAVAYEVAHHMINCDGKIVLK